MVGPEVCQLLCPVGGLGPGLWLQRERGKKRQPSVRFSHHPYARVCVYVYVCTLHVCVPYMYCMCVSVFVSLYACMCVYCVYVCMVYALSVCMVCVCSCVYIVHMCACMCVCVYSYLWSLVSEGWRQLRCQVEETASRQRVILKGQWYWSAGMPSLAIWVLAAAPSRTRAYAFPPGLPSLTTSPQPIPAPRSTTWAIFKSSH